MTENDVVALLGRPLFKQSRSFLENWVYDEPASRPAALTREGFFHRSYAYVPRAPDSFTSLFFDEKGGLKSVYGAHLSIEVLKECGDSADVLRSFGAPTRKTVRRPYTELIYSQAARGGDFDMRAVEIGDQGKVTAIVASRWHD